MKGKIFVLVTMLALVVSFGAQTPTVEGEFPDPQITVYVVPPITDVKILPTTSISSSYISNQISIAACPGEYEPASFVIRADEDIASLEVEATELTGPSGSIPSSNVDIRVVKCWYQAGVEIWDPDWNKDLKVFTPELLLKDDTLVKVEGGENYVKETIGVYKWISELQYRPEYSTPKPGDELSIEDALTLQPVNISAGTNKQFWVTVKVPDNAVAGNYTGKINLTAPGISQELQLELEVLPIELAPPLLDYSLYYFAKLVDSTPYLFSDAGRTEQQMIAEHKNMLEHGVPNPIERGWQASAWPDIYSKITSILAFRQTLGMSNNPFYFYAAFVDLKTADWGFLKEKTQELMDVVAPYGVTDFYWYGVDETPDPDAMRDGIAALHEVGAKVYCAISKTNAARVPDILDLVIAGGAPDSSLAATYHNYGNKIFCYANPQVGQEKPLTYRRNHGLLVWQGNYDGSMQFAYQWSAGNPWNDFDSAKWRDHNFVYPTINGVIDTIQWEGFREGVDDVRYLTTLLNVIEEVKAQGKDTSEAENYLANLKTSDLDTKDLDVVRSEMIVHILSLQEEVPLAEFSATPTTGNEPLDVQFTDQSTGSITSWLWDFGNEATSTVQNPLHTYTSAGVYTVSLTVTDSLTTNSDTETKTDYISVYEPAPFIPGDANEDGVVNSLDITKVKRIIMGLDEPTPGADANGDGNINALDITQIELIIMGS